MGDRSDGSLLTPDPQILEESGEEVVMETWMIFTSPEFETEADEQPLVDLIANTRTGGVEVTMSDSMEHITKVVLAIHGVTPYLDRFDMTSDVD